MSAELPGWPNAEDFKTELESGARIFWPGNRHEYDCALLAAYAARLRRAMPFMKHDLMCYQMPPSQFGVTYSFVCGEPMKAVKCVCGLDAALAEIGPLPDSPSAAGEM